MTQATSAVNLLDSTLDDLADLPAFKPYPNGAHRVTLKFAEKQIGDHPAVELTLTLVEHKELVDATQEHMVAGTECSVAYMLDNEFGVGKLKEVLKPLSVATGKSKLQEIMDDSRGMEVTVVTTTRADKTDPDKLYLNIKKLIVE